MTLTYLLDTNVISEGFRPHPNETVLRNLRERSDSIGLPAPVWHELTFGWSLLPPSRRKDELQNYLRNVVYPAYPILEYDEQAAEWHGVERARLTKTGTPPSFFDGQIAAIGATRNLTVVTNNIKDFKRFRGLSLENWFKRTKRRKPST